MTGMKELLLLIGALLAPLAAHAEAAGTMLMWTEPVIGASPAQVERWYEKPDWTSHVTCWDLHDCNYVARFRDHVVWFEATGSGSSLRATYVDMVPPWNQYPPVAGMQ